MQLHTSFILVNLLVRMLLVYSQIDFSRMNKELRRKLKLHNMCLLEWHRYLYYHLPYLPSDDGAVHHFANIFFYAQDEYV